MKGVWFELKKLSKQRILFAMLLAAFVAVFALFCTYKLNETDLSEQAYGELKVFQVETDRIHNQLREEKEFTSNWSEAHQQQLDQIIDLQHKLSNWDIAIFEQNWQAVIEERYDFLQASEHFVAQGGELFQPSAQERAMLLEKTEWLLNNNLQFENEETPLSPHLFLKKVADLLFNLAGLVLLVVFLSHTVWQEKEEQTWLLLRIQPKRLSSWYIERFIAQMIVFHWDLFLLCYCLDLVYRH